jgi:biotin carboxyl carrier protein
MLFDATIDGRTVRVEVRGSDGRYAVTVDGRTLDVDHQETGAHFVSLLIGGRSYEAGLEKRPEGYNVVLAEDVLYVELRGASRGALASPRNAEEGPARVLAPMPGRLVRVLVEPGQQVQAGDGLVVVEAMKMENELRSPRAGRIAQLLVREGQAVETAALLVVVE